MSKTSIRKTIIPLDNSSDFFRAYLNARRHHPTGPVIVAAVLDSEGQPICFGSPSEWPIGTAARVLRQELTVECREYGLVEERKERDEKDDNLERKENKPEVEQLLQPHSHHTSSSLLTQFALNQLEADMKFMRSLVYGVFCDQGERSNMEDEYTLIREFDEIVYNQHLTAHCDDSLCTEKCASLYRLTETFGFQSFCGVYDGHLGTEAAEYCRDRLHLNIAQHLLEQSDVCEAMRLGCLQTDREFLDYAQREKIESGAVMITAVLSGKQLYLANAGDCRAVLCRAGKSISLTKDHKPLAFEEKLRLENEGAPVECGALGGMLDVSRALGDVDPETGEKLKGLTAEPETFKLYITDDDEFVIVACDGLWDVIDSELAVKLTRNSLRDDNDVEKTAHSLVQQALSRGSEDNITAVIIGFSKTAPDGTQYIIPTPEDERNWKHKGQDLPKETRPKKLGPRAFKSLHASLASCELKSPTPTRSSSGSSIASLSRSTSSLSSSSRSSSAEDLTKISLSSTESPSDDSHYRFKYPKITKDRLND